MKILFVCTGNTCRSPMAEEVARLLIEKLGMEGVEFSSAGLYAESGMPASLGAQDAVRLIGGDLSYHRATRVTPDRVSEAGLILCMTDAHKKMLHGLVPESTGKIFTLLEYVDGSGDIPDPFGGDTAVYEKCLEEIGSAVRAALQKLK